MAQVGHGPRLGTRTKFNPKADIIRSYFERFENCIDSNNVSTEKILKLFLNVLGPQANEELKKMFVPGIRTHKTFNEINELLETNFSPTRAIIAERRKFNRRVQQNNENV